MYCAGGIAAMQFEPLGFVSDTQRDRLTNCKRASGSPGKKAARVFSKAKPLLPIEHLAEKLIEFLLAIKPKLVTTSKSFSNYLKTRSSSISIAQMRLSFG
jgi:hypothetical protein